MLRAFLRWLRKPTWVDLWFAKQWSRIHKDAHDTYDRYKLVLTRPELIDLQEIQRRAFMRRAEWLKIR